MTVVKHNPELRRPEDLNGTMLTLLLPLTGPEIGLLGARGRAPFDPSTDPYLYARANFVALAPSRQWEPGGAGRYWAWPEATLLAHTRRDGGGSVVFGRSAATVAERSVGDQPLDISQGRAMSLWHAEGAGFVLALEWLRADVDVASETARLGSLLSEAKPEGGVESERSIDSLLTHFACPRGTSLGSMFESQLSDLAALKPEFVSASLTDLLVHRRTAILGERLIEGILTGVSAARRDLGVKSLLRIGHDADDDFERQRQYIWSYEPLVVASDPADESAVSAMRSDARVAVLDLDAFSIYHDYLGPGGDTTVAELIPLVAVLGRKARDFWDVSDRVAALAGRESSTRESVSRLRADLHVARTVRARNELRRLLFAQLFNDSNFTAWTEPTHLRRVLARIAMADSLTPSAASSGLADDLSGSVEVLEHLLALRQQEATNRSRSLLQAVLGVFTGVGLLGLFAAIASVPGKDREIQSFVEAGLWTLLSTTVLGVVIAAGWSLLQSSSGSGSPRLPSVLVLAGTVAASGTFSIGLVLGGASSGLLLLVGVTVLLVTIGFALRRLPPVA